MTTSESNSAAQVSPPEYRVVAAKVYDPKAPSIFGKSPKSDRATYSELTCSCASCPLLANRQCVQTQILGGYCPYGNYRTETGPTQRAGSYWEWVSEHKEQAKQRGGWLKFPAEKLAFIGDYVYIPYSHADMCEAVFTKRKTFLPKADWTIENVLRLIDFRPRDWFGGEIKSYQADKVPLLIAHIREVDPAMWTELIAKRPQLDKPQNYVGRKALLRTLASPITIPPYDNRYPVSWTWDGEYATTTDKDCYGSTWGKLPADELRLKLKPRKDAAIIVSDNAWVTNETVFID